MIMSLSTEILEDGILKTNKLIELPEVLDVLIVGGGPGGTAAAFHAKEIGLTALVIELDDILRRIRDYTTGKNIYPSFGGGDNMSFPKGGDIFSLLHFSDIDKDDMFKQWKEFYRENNIPAKIGVELSELQLAKDGTWECEVWNQNTKSKERILAKHVVLAMGRGLPRRFDIPGNTMDIAYRLADPKDYLGQPVCVIGSGTSAAEAVIDISNAKAEANDEAAVYWCYRGEKLPKVSQALAEVFFKAYSSNGNILSYPKSEPVAVVAAEDGKDYLSIRTDRKQIAGRPSETLHLEFNKDFCIACIGEDIPEGLLNSCGIYMANGGSKNKKRMLVSPFLETQQPNIYLVGAILAPAYFVTEDFNADPATYREEKQRDNIKAALINGLYVTEVIAQKLAGKKEIQVELEFIEDKVEKAEKIKELTAKPEKVVESDGPPQESFVSVRQAEEDQAFLVRMISGNVEENQYPIRTNGTTTIGRKDCDITLPDDTLLSDKHASISHGPEGYFLRDDGSKNGVFLIAPEGRFLEIIPGSIVRTGRQFLVFLKSNGVYQFIHYDQTGKELRRYDIPNKTILLGRDAPDVILDAKDMTLSGRHLALSVKEDKILIKDLKSVNGTYLKLKDSRKLEDYDRFKVGQQVFVFTLKEDAVVDAGYMTSRPAMSVPPIKKPEVSEPEATEPKPGKAAAEVKSESAVTFKNTGQTFPLEPGKTICDIAEANGTAIKAECHAGICGSDPIKILSGKENLNELGDDEKDVLEDICSVNPDECRLACMVVANGPITVEIL